MAKHLAVISSLALVGLALSACGRRGGDGGTAANTTAAQNTVAEAPAKDTAPALKCPSGFNIPPASAGGPVDDVGGLRIGTPLDDAVLYIQCQGRPKTYMVLQGNGGFRVEAPGGHIRQQTRVADGKTPAYGDVDLQFRAYREGYFSMRLDDASDDYHLLSLGRAGQELVEGVWRTQTYRRGEAPPAAEAAKALVAKYGQPGKLDEGSLGATMTWLYDTYGRRLSEQTPGFSSCASQISATYGNEQATPECGLMIVAHIEKASDNELLAKALSVGVMNPSKVYKDVGALDAEGKMENNARKLQELQAAGANKTGVKL